MAVIQRVRPDIIAKFRQMAEDPLEELLKPLRCLPAIKTAGYLQTAMK
jgi:hypothetical protein